MPKGMTTAAVAVLCAKAPAIEAVARALSARFEVKRVEAGGADGGWMGGRGFALVSFRPKVNGYVIVEPFDAPWPDGMGDPKAGRDLFGAWTMGFFGPGVYPHALARATEAPILCPAAAPATARHRAFLRVRASY